MPARDNRTRYALLGALTLGPKSGYDIKKFLDGSVAHFWREGYGQIYPMLTDLERAGLVRARARAGVAKAGSRETGSDPGRRKRELEITDEGRTALAAWLAEPPGPNVLRVEILLKLFFARHAGPGAARRIVEAFQQEEMLMIGRYRAIAASLSETHAGHPDLPYWLLTLDYGRRVGTAHVEWAERATETLGALAGDVSLRGHGEGVRG